MSDDKITKKQFKYIKKKAAQGDADAQFNLGACYARGDGVEKNLEKTVEWWTKAAEQGDAGAQYNLGVCYDNGEGVEKNLKEAVKWYKKAAEQGDASAQCNLGACYHNGDGVEKNLEEAVKWYEKAAEQGHAGAQFNLGVCYKNGDCVDEDPEEAVKWYEKAAEQGHAPAQCNLGLCYGNGDGVEQDLEEAVEWLTKAAEQGEAIAQFNLGLCHHNGCGVDEDPEEAVKWFKKAAEQGYAPAQCNLGVCYENGWRGVEKDPEEAVKWFKKAAEQGYAPAQFNLGLCYENGECVDEDLEEAVKWYKKSFNGGFEIEGEGGFEIEGEGGFEIEGEVELPPLAKIISIIHKIFKEQRVDENKLKSIASITHFTSVDVLKKLLEDPNEKKGFLRIQNIDGCNDPMEGKTLYERLNIPDLECPDMNDSYPLILSLCDGSPENLPMWNTYADNAKGVALGVDKNSLKKYTENEEHYILKTNSLGKQKDELLPILYPILKDELLPILYRVLYVNRPSGDVESEPNTPDNDVESETNTSYELLDELKNVVQDEANSKYIKDIKDIKEYKEYMNILSNLLVELSHIVKYDDYEYEKEIRLVRFAFKDDISDKNNPLKHCSNSHRVYMEAKHIKFEVITTAPKVSEKMYKYIKYLGDKNNIDKVIKSKISYR